MQTSDTASGESFDEVLDRLEATLRIDLIAADELASCQRDELCSSVLERGEWARFDQFPVRDDERVIGVLERRADLKVGVGVTEAMRPLDDSLIVSASTGILSYIRLAKQSPYHLVVRDRAIPFIGAGFCALLVVLHGIFPKDFVVDDTSVALVVVASLLLLLPLLPTLARYLTRLRLPGVDTHFREVTNRAAVRLQSVRAPRETPDIAASISRVLEFTEVEPDPNVRIAKTAIQLERELRAHTQRHNIDASRLSLRQMAQTLLEHQVITHEQTATLQDIASLRNAAVHGATLEPTDAVTFEALVERFLESLLATPSGVPQGEGR